MTDPRKAPVVDFPFAAEHPEVKLLADHLRSSLGKIVAIADVTLLSVPAGYAVAAAPGTTIIPGTRTAIDFGDSNINDCRIVVDGKTALFGPITVQVRDATANLVLCSTTVTITSTTLAVGAWTTFVPTLADHVVQLEVIGDNANGQTLYSAHFQLRTLSFNR